MIVVYTQPDCRPCKRVIQKLEDAGIDHEVVDLSKNLIARDYVTKVLRVSSTPIVESDEGTLIAGYQPDKLKKLIEVIKYVKGEQ